jgi:hypothetical protein
MLNGEPIVAIATGIENKSANVKTGPMIQIWILAQEETPATAAKSGKDAAVCGDCPLRPSATGACYVTLFQGPRSIWATWKRDGYKPMQLSEFAGKSVRFGAYGDPAAVPFEILDEIGMQASLVTGYTHQWRTCDPLHKHYCMASVEDEEGAIDAVSRGWRTFRVTTQPGDRSLSNEVICPASEEAGHKIQCIQCGACDGTASNRKSQIVIHAHGSRTKKFRKEFGNGDT